MGKGRVMAKRRKKALAVEDQNRDPSPYSGPLRRIDGTAPFNMYLWPMPEDLILAPAEFETWVNKHDLRIGLVALADGRWLTDGHVRRDMADMTFYPSRRAALRSAAAGVIYAARNARYDDGLRGRGRHYWQKPPMPEADAQRLIAWVYALLGEGGPRSGLMPLTPALRNWRGQRITPPERIEVYRRDDGKYGWRSVGGDPGSMDDGGPYATAQKARAMAQSFAGSYDNRHGAPVPVVIAETKQPKARMPKPGEAEQLRLAL